MACLIIVSTPGPGFVMIKAMFGQVDDEVGHAFPALKSLVVVVGWSV